MTFEEMKERIEFAHPTLLTTLITAVQLIMKHGDIADFPPTAAMNFRQEGSPQRFRIFFGVEAIDE